MPYIEDVIVEGHDLFMMMNINENKFWNFHEEFNGISRVSKEFRDLFHQMTDMDAINRITLNEIKKSKWYNGSIYSTKDLKQKLNFLKTI